MACGRGIASRTVGNANEPQLTATDRGVILSWIERSGQTTTLKFAERTASGWTSPLSVAAGNDWFVSYADAPTVMRLSDGTLVGAWMRQTDPLREAMDLQLSRSGDNPMNVTTGPLVANPDLSKVDEIGWVDLAPGGGRCVAVWANMSTIAVYAKTVPR